MDDRAKQMFTVIEDCVRYSEKIVEDLLDYSREVSLRYVDVDVVSLVRDALAQVNIPEAVHVESPQSRLVISIDPEKMKRVFINMIENAIDAMPEGGSLTIRIKESGEKAEISFTDTGTGMPKEVVERLWRPLETTKAKGIGMGLAICKRIVDAHAGSVSVESEVGEGSTFTIALPIKAKHQLY